MGFEVGIPELVLVLVVAALIFSAGRRKASDDDLFRSHLHKEFGRMPVYSAETASGKEAEFIRDRLPKRFPIVIVLGVVVISAPSRGGSRGERCCVGPAGSNHGFSSGVPNQNIPAVAADRDTQSLARRRATCGVRRLGKVIGRASSTAVTVKKPKTDFDLVRDIGLSLPDVKHTVSPRGQGLKVKGKLMACHAIHKSAEPGSIVVRVSADERSRLMSRDPETYYITDHYEHSAVVLVRLSSISRTELRRLLSVSWQYVYEGALGKRAK